MNTTTIKTMNSTPFTGQKPNFSLGDFIKKLLKTCDNNPTCHQCAFYDQGTCHASAALADVKATMSACKSFDPNTHTNG